MTLIGDVGYMVETDTIALAILLWRRWAPNLAHASATSAREKQYPFKDALEI